MSRLAIIGSGGHARSVLDAVAAAGEHEPAGFVGPGRDAGYRGVGLLGGDGDLPAMRESGIGAAALGIGHLGGASPARENAATAAIAAGFDFPPIVDPTASLASDAQVERGAFVGKQAVVNSAARVGEFAIVNSGAVVEHDCSVGAWAHVACNATLCGGVSVGAGALVGAGATVVQGVSIGERAIVGAGSVVLADVPEGSTVYGVYNGKR